MNDNTQHSRGLVNLAGILIIGILVGRYVIPSGSSIVEPSVVRVDNKEQVFEFPAFWEAWDELHDKYIEELDDEALLYGAVRGMVAATDDPYTVFSNPEDTKQFQETLQGSFSGVGIEIGMQNGLVTVIAPLDGSPAAEAGMREEDVIIAIDNEAITQSMTLDDVVKKIRGPQGENVTLTVVHKDEREPQDITIVRDVIQVESLRVEMIEGNIAHIELLNFNGDTSGEFTQLARQLRADNVEGIILDMRSNPGGFLHTAVDVASHFLAPGEVVVREKGKEEKEYAAQGASTLQDVPVVVLVNRGSASASEIVAGALQDERSAPVVGTQTFGKGSVQELVTLSDGSSLRVTVARWYTPSGRSITEEGIEPTIEVQYDRDTDEDEQFDRALEEIRSMVR